MKVTTLGALRRIISEAIRVKRPAVEYQFNVFQPLNHVGDRLQRDITDEERGLWGPACDAIERAADLCAPIPVRAVLETSSTGSGQTRCSAWVMLLPDARHDIDVDRTGPSLAEALQALVPRLEERLEHLVAWAGSITDSDRDLDDVECGRCGAWVRAHEAEEVHHEELCPDCAHERRRAYGVSDDGGDDAQ